MTSDRLARVAVAACRRACRDAAAVLLLVLAAGCAGVQERRPYVQEFTAEPYGRVCSIAVLPFTNKSRFDQGGRVVQRMFTSELVAGGNWRVALEGDVRKIYRQLHLRPWERPTPEQIKVIASWLGVERLVGGTVVEMEEKLGRNFVSPVLEVELVVFDGATGRVTFSTIYRKSGEDYRTMMHFGLVNSVTGLIKKMAEEILATWRQKGFVPCDERS